MATLRLTALAVVAGCGIFSPDCLLQAEPGLAIFLSVEGRTEALEVDSLLVVASDGAYADSLRAAGVIDFPVTLAYERPGIYVVDVRASGFETWRREGIEVGPTGDGCHVETVRVDVELTPAAP